MQDAELLGLPLDEALRRLKEAGRDMRVTETVAPRTQRVGGRLRVVRVKDGELVVSAFMDGQPSSSTDKA